MSFHVPNEYRVRSGSMASDDSLGNEGAFRIPSCRGKRILFVVCSDQFGWEHVSVSARGRTNGGQDAAHTPHWEEMAQVKDMFWDEEDTVIQFHPPKSEYVNEHPNVLHLWRPIGVALPLPPSILVGFKKK